MLFKELQKQWISRPRFILGIMSGTSLDGIDLCLAEFSTDEHSSDHYTIKAYRTYPLPNELRTTIQQAMSNNLNTSQLSALQSQITHYHADMIHQFIYEFKPETIDLLAAHGQTIWHNPPGKESEKPGDTLQLLSVPALAALTGITSTGDFRSADIALNGQGAPLVPVFDAEFLHSNEQDTIALNIGGMANITIIPAQKSEQVRAFDTGPGNILIDEAMLMFFGKKYDEKGAFASAGRRIKRLWQNLCELEFIYQPPPKSTGREFFNRELLKDILEVSFVNTFPAEDIIRTITDFTAWSIAENIRTYANPAARIFVSGGGVHNTVIMQELAKELPHSIIQRTEAAGIPADAKEALCFGYLGWLMMAGKPISLPSVTGATRPAYSGSLAFSATS
jgi:anhydro-N-acetylmuramic acid kinase